MRGESRKRVAAIAALTGVHLLAGAAMWLAAPMFLPAESVPVIRANPPGEAWLLYLPEALPSGRDRGETPAQPFPALAIGSQRVTSSGQALPGETAFDSSRLPPDTALWIETPSAPARAVLQASRHTWPRATGRLLLPKPHLPASPGHAPVLPLEVDGAQWMLSAESLELARRLYRAALSWAAADVAVRPPWPPPSALSYWLACARHSEPVALGAAEKSGFVLAAPSLLDSSAHAQDPLRGAVPMEWDGVAGHALLPGPWGDSTVVARTRSRVCVASDESLMPSLLKAVREATPVRGASAHLTASAKWWSSGPEALPMDLVSPIMDHPIWRFDLMQLEPGSFRLDARPAGVPFRNERPLFAGALTARREVEDTKVLGLSLDAPSMETQAVRLAQAVLRACADDAFATEFEAQTWALVRLRAGGSGALLAYLPEDDAGRRSLTDLVTVQAALECATNAIAAPEAWLERLDQVRLEIAASLVGTDCCLEEAARTRITDGLPAAVQEGLRSLPACGPIDFVPDTREQGGF